VGAMWVNWVFDVGESGGPLTAPFNEMWNHVEQLLSCHSQPQFCATEKLR
jgi:hypothetical protein